jgi:hypothetical protein
MLSMSFYVAAGCAKSSPEMLCVTQCVAVEQYLSRLFDAFLFLCSGNTIVVVHKSFILQHCT